MRSPIAMRRIYVGDPRMVRLVLVMALHGGGGSKVTYGSVFFHWLRNQLLNIEDYAYEGEYFLHDLELPLQNGEERDDRGKKDVTIHVFNFSIFYLIFIL